MRLRQAHAILEAGTALAAIGFELHPLDHDDPNAVGLISDDYLTGYAEFNDPDRPNSHTRTYNIDIKPTSDGKAIEVYLGFGYGADAPCLLYAKASVGPRNEDDVAFRDLVGASIADRVVEEVRKNEQPYQEEHRLRTLGPTPSAPEKPR